MTGTRRRTRSSARISTTSCSPTPPNRGRKSGKRPRSRASSSTGPGEKAWLEERFDWLLARSARMTSILAGSRRTIRVFGISDYSTSSARAAGEGWALVGDAATFLDPVFSTGVFLAMAMGERAARAIDRALARHGRVNTRDLQGYENYANRLVARFRRFVYAFYDPLFFEAFCTEAPNESM